jgi:hypothetical protein
MIVLILWLECICYVLGTWLIYSCLALLLSGWYPVFTLYYIFNVLVLSVTLSYYLVYSMVFYCQYVYGIVNVRVRYYTYIIYTYYSIIQYKSYYTLCQYVDNLYNINFAPFFVPFLYLSWYCIGLLRYIINLAHVYDWD